MAFSPSWYAKTVVAHLVQDVSGSCGRGTEVAHKSVTGTGLTAFLNDYT